MNFNLLSSLGIVIDEKLKEEFLKYIEIFKNYNSHTNLISKNDINVLFEKHIYDSLAFNLFVQKYKMPESIMDIGTGGGFPSVPLSLVLKNAKILAVDSTAKKINFIKQVKNELKIANLITRVSRVEELPHNLKENFDCVTTRALGALPLVLEYAIPYLKVGGYFVAYKSQDSEKELNLAKNVLKMLKTELVDIIEYKLPLEENFDRKLMIFKKLAKISKIYPRPYNTIKNAS